MLGIITDVIRPPEWSIRLCKWLWGKRELFWGAFILGVIANVFATWLVTPFSASYRHSPIGWMIQNPTTVFLMGVSILALNVLVYLGTLFDRGSEIQTERKYLRRMQEETRVLKLTGIPADLIAPGVPLDEVFIPLRFRRNQARTDQPLTEREFPGEREIGSGAAHGFSAQERARIRFQAMTSSWQGPYQEQATLGIAELWSTLTLEQPAAVIQGFPGMGKTTLIDRLTLHMARRGLTPDRLDRPTDPLLLAPRAEVLTPILVPLRIRLSEYAAECQHVPNLSLTDYLVKIALQRYDIRHLEPVIEKRLAGGHCLVLFDGLDEVSEPQIRSQVQLAIQTFVRNWSSIVGGKSAESFNRFLVTSRVAGFDPNAFPDFHHVVIADLTPEQIEGFLPRWCRATVRRDRGGTTADAGGQELAIAREAERQARLLSAAIRAQQGVRELAVNPLLLTLLAVMQQNGIELPRQRVELYRIVTQTLLENRNIARGLPEIAESEAIQRLGPLAYHMQADGKRFISYADVLASVKQTIIVEQGGTPEQAEREAEKFVRRVRERAGLFVQRTDDYYGFFHRTFQEYFAARYLLNEISRDSNVIADLAAQARRSDELWREPVLFAVAYKSRDGGSVASDMIRAILMTPPEAGSDLHMHDLLLAAECVIESKPLTIDVALCRQIIEELVQFYETSYLVPDALVPRLIEDVVSRWLLSVHQEAYQHPLLDALTTDLGDGQRGGRVCALLTLLAVIAERLDSCREVVFRTLVPSVAAIAGLTEADGERPRTSQLLTPEPIATDLALAVLSGMRGQGSPSAVLLQRVRRQIDEHPEYLRALAQSSIESQILMTPTVAPLEADARERYDASLLRWKRMRDSGRLVTRTKAVLAQCMNIHKVFLDAAEGVRYPCAMDLIHLLQVATDRPAEPWQWRWQTSLSGQLAEGHYASYQGAELLWLALLPEPHALAGLASLLISHFTGSEPELYRCARRVLAFVSSVGADASQYESSLLNDFAFLLSQQDADFIFRLEDRLGMRYRRFPQSWEGLRRLLQRIDNSLGGTWYEHYRQALEDRTSSVAQTNHLRSPETLRVLFASQQIGSWNGPLSANKADAEFDGQRKEVPHMSSSQTNGEYAHVAEAYGELQRIQDRRVLRHMLLTRAVGDHARTLLIARNGERQENSAADSTVDTDLVAILRGRIRALAEGDGTDIEDAGEVEQIAEAMLGILAMADDEKRADEKRADEKRAEACLGLLSSLPIRSEHEVALVLRVVSSTSDPRVYGACAHALICATPYTPKAWAALGEAVVAPVAVVRTAAHARLELISSLEDRLQGLAVPKYRRSIANHGNVPPAIDSQQVMSRPLL